MSIERLVNYFKKTDLDGQDIIKLIHKPVVLYSDLKNYSNLNQLLGNEGYVVILYQTSSKTTGHFVCLFIREGKIHFQDSYGLAPDSEQQYAQYDQPLPRYLTQLIESDGRPIVWNKHDFQSKNPNVATCGRWSCVRIMLKDLDNQQFQQVFYGNNDSYLTPDNLIVMLTLIGLHNIQEFYQKNR
jgi:hypothetical protein